MDLNLYFDPVSILKDEQRNVPETEQLSHKLTVYTPDFPIQKNTPFDIAIFGVPEDRNALHQGAAFAPDLIRKKFYSLAKFPQKIRIADLGNMKRGRQINDTYKGLETILSYLLERNVLPVIIGGSQDLTLPVLDALYTKQSFIRLVTVDPRIDLSKKKKERLSDTYLSEILGKHKKGLHYTQLGHQEFLSSTQDLKLLRNRGHEVFRVGEVRNNLSNFEPFFRDADMVSIDFSAVRQSEAPGTSNPVPGGFTIDEICLLSKYAGLSPHLKMFSLFEISPENDRGDQTIAVAAQVLWYFINGFIHRKIEHPETGGKNFTEYIITLPDTDYRLVFRKSEETGRWWIQFPEDISSADDRRWMACNYEDYKLATHHEIPARWLNLFQ